ncbi:hypothetical protein HELRODRAFT_190991, partial [Helobdella robusta]|uniref:Protein SHQ1 homolog n=1 Tax=Helobdella robusta TaxID=6412 RepID=T1FSH2_HELRO
MITPYFRITQDASFVEVLIKARHVKITADSEPEICIDGHEFKFYCKPYYLRLNFSHELIEDGRETAAYDDGYFRIKVPKANPGEEFLDLDLLTKLLTVRGKTEAKPPSIEIITDKLNGLSTNSGNLEDEENEVLEDDEIDWHIDQQPVTHDGDEDDDPTNVSIKKPMYGFGHLRSGVFKTLKEELDDVVDLKNVDGVDEEMRRKMRTDVEDAAFDEEHYLADLYERGAIDELIAFAPDWLSNDSQKVEFTDDEKEVMMKLPHRDYLLSEADLRHTYLGLVDILYAYAYDH